MRGPLAAALVAFVLSASAYACDSFDEPGSDAAAGDSGAATDAPGASDAASNDGSDGAACLGEPEWATNASANKTATCDGATVDLLATPAHCGRCNHSCGTDACVNGTCAPRTEDDGACILAGVHDGALFYSKRPGGTFSGIGHEVKRLAPGQAPVVLASLEVDGGTDEQIVSLAFAPDAVYLRTSATLRRTSATVPTAEIPELVATLTNEAASSIAFAGDRVYVPAPSQTRIDQVFLDGGVSPFLQKTSDIGETLLVGARYFWLSQPFIFYLPGTSSLTMHEGTADTRLYDSEARIGGIAVFGNDLYLMRAGIGGAIMHVDLTTRATRPFFEDDFPNPGTGLTVAVDATHVYWAKALDDLGANYEIWKRARCGGAAVRIGKYPGVYRIVPFGDRLYVGGEGGLASIAK